MDTLPLQLEIHPNSGVPIYRQVIDQVRALVASGKLPAGTLLPSVRQLAAALEVNMMTISKAYGRLELEGVVERLRGTGMRVRESAADASLELRLKDLRPLAESVVTRGEQLGLNGVQIIGLIHSVVAARTLPGGGVSAPAPRNGD